MTAGLAGTTSCSRRGSDQRGRHVAGSMPEVGPISYPLGRELVASFLYRVLSGRQKAGFSTAAVGTLAPKELHHLAASLPSHVIGWALKQIKHPVSRRPGRYPKADVESWCLVSERNLAA